MFQVFSSVRNQLQQKQFLIYTYIIFLAGFYFSPNSNIHRNFLYLFVLVPFVIATAPNEILNCFRSAVFKLSLLFLVYYLISMLWSKTEINSKEYIDQIRYFTTLILFFIATISISVNSKRFFSKIIFGLCLIALVASIFYIISFYSSHRFPLVRVRGPITYTRNPNQAAMYFGFVAILALYSRLFSQNRWHKVFYWVVFLTLSVYLLLSQSRGALLAFFLSTILGLALEKRWWEIAIIIAICAVLIFLVEIRDIGVITNQKRGFGNRPDIWLVTLKRISQAPLIGEGYFTDVHIQTTKYLESSPHNLLLLVMLKSGLVGGGLLIVAISAALAKSYKYFIDSGNWIYLCIFAYFLICMTFDSVYLLYKPSLAWLIFWMPVAFIAAEEIRDIHLRKTI